MAAGTPMISALRTILAVIAVFAATALPCRGEDESPSGTFLNPFPEGDVYQATVVGDSFADGLLAGILEAFANDTRLNIQRKPRPLEGIMSPRFEDKMREIEDSISKDPAGIVIVMVGEDDRVSLKSSSGRRVAIMSPEWRTEYARRIDRVIKALKQKTAGVYWVGLPNLARSEANEQARAMNEVIRERAYQNGLRYIDVFAGFEDENGDYSPYGPDLTGKVRALREGDGVHFTEAGNRKLAHFVEKELRRDLNQAKSERSIPLAGNEAEQARINPDNAVKVPAPSSPAATGKLAEPQAQKPVVSAPVDTSGDQKADNGKINLKVFGAGGKEETQTLEIVRPALPASIVALMSRREGAGQFGDLLVDQIAGGITLMSSISASGQKGQGKLSPSQAPYFRLLVKGERLTPKPGRADDVLWQIQRPDSSSNAAKPDEPKG